MLRRAAAIAAVVCWLPTAGAVECYPLGTRVDQGYSALAGTYPGYCSLRVSSGAECAQVERISGNWDSGNYDAWNGLPDEQKYRSECLLDLGLLAKWAGSVAQVGLPASCALQGAAVWPCPEQQHGWLCPPASCF